MISFHQRRSLGGIESAGTRASVVSRTHLVLPRLCLAGFALFTTSCGLLDVYKDKEKRCKINCKTDNSNANKNDEPFNFDLTYWNQTTPRSKLDPATEVAALLRGNPFKLLSNALKTLSDDITDAKQSVASTENSTQSKCLKEIFDSVLERNAQQLKAKLDYGRCVDLQKLEERLNTNRNTARDGVLKVLELGSALQMTLNGNLPLLSGGDALQDSQTAFELTGILPFKGTRAAELLEPNTEKSFSMHIIRGSVQGTALERSAAATVLKKSWGLIYAGLDEQQPLKISWAPSQGRVKVNGSLATLSASFQRPTTQTQWDSFGYSREYIFTDFQISSEALEMGPQLGWSEQANLSGSYFLRLNGDLVETGGDGSQLFRFQGTGRPCVLNVGLVTAFDGDIPVEQSVGQVSICSNTP
jgi:hypothetical protein